MQKHLSVKNQSVESSGITKDFREAICEYIWNGFEAGATKVEVTYTLNSLDGIDTITIIDNGKGIEFESLEDTFGAFLASQKNSLSVSVKSKDNKGKGRFSFNCFAANAEWITTYKKDNTFFRYTISLSGEQKDVYEFTPLEKSSVNQSGTIVNIFNNISGFSAEDLQIENIEEFLLKEYSWFLYLQRKTGCKLIFSGKEIDYKKYIDESLSEQIDLNIGEYSFNVNIIVWSEKISETYCAYYFDKNDTMRDKDTTNFNRNTVQFNHSIYIKSAYFDNWSHDATEFDELIGEDSKHSKKSKTFKQMWQAVKEIVSKKLREFLLRQSDDVVKGMIERKTFPSYSDDFYSQMKKADMIRVTKELYCLEPRIFYRLKDIQEKSLLGFLDLLLNSEERENVLTIIEGIVELTPKQRQEFAGMLQNTKMQNIVESIKLVEDRYRIIEILRTLIYDLTAFTNERDHIQEIIENHYWLFGEQYNLVSADKRMQVALERYRHILDGTNETNLALLGNDEANRRMDIFLAGARKTIDSADNILDENLIIELKKPSVKLDKVVYRQIEDYMEYIRKQPEFNSQYRIWKFIAVCATVDDFILERYKAFENRNKKCLVLQVENYEVYAMTWDDVFKSFDIRHSFILDKLKYNRDSLAQKIKEQTKGHSRDLSDEITLAAVGDN